MTTTTHEPRSETTCSCGARFKSRAKLRKHISVWSPEPAGIGFAPHAPDFHQKKKRKV